MTNDSKEQILSFDEKDDDKHKTKPISNGVLDFIHILLGIVYTEQSYYTNRPSSSRDRSLDQFSVLENSYRVDYHRIPSNVCWLVRYVWWGTNSIRNHFRPNRTINLQLRPISLVTIHNKLAVCLSTFFYTLTLSSAVAISITNTWHQVMYIKQLALTGSDEEKKLILIQTFSMIIFVGFSTIATYTQSLAHRIYTSAHLSQLIQRRVKSLYGINILIILIILIISFSTLFMSSMYPYFFNNHQNETSNSTDIIPHYEAIICRYTAKPVCFVWYSGMIVYLFMLLLWSFLVLSTLLSICRTFTLNIRILLRVLNEDCLNIMKLKTIFLRKRHCKLVFENSSLHNELATVVDQTGNSEQNKNNVTDLFYLINDKKQNNVISEGNNGNEEGYLTETEEYHKQTNKNCLLAISKNFELEKSLKCSSCFQVVGQDETNISQRCEHTLCSDTILYFYYKCLTNMRIASRQFQRWLAVWIVYTIVWCVMQLVYWIWNETTLTQILMFLLPMIILFLILSSLSETNAESNRLLKCVYPLNERRYLLRYMQQHELHFTIYGASLTYILEVKVISAFLLGFISQIVLKEMKIK
ncbi:hypothetical protein SNEBB_010632 [Seison nebaliae]|nr:hypothetical protein SNEBB_010632 [Seison nebaliae]